MSLISCENLAFAYEGITVLQNVNFTVEQGQYLCIMGENGAGKSTLMKGLLGLKKPSAGSVTFGDGLRAREIGYLPQQTPVQLLPMFQIERSRRMMPRKLPQVQEL